MLRLILFVRLAYLVWRVLESVLKLTGRQNQPPSNIKGGSRPPGKPQQNPFRDIRDAEFEDLTPKKDDKDKPPVPGS
jgi:hypothetical protein